MNNKYDFPLLAIYSLIFVLGMGLGSFLSKTQINNDNWLIQKYKYHICDIHPNYVLCYSGLSQDDRDSVRRVTESLMEVK